MRIALNPPDKLPLTALAAIQDPEEAITKLGLTVSYAGTRPRDDDDLIAQPDLALWNSVKDSNRRDELQAYLTQHPNGHFAELARARLSSRYDTE